MEALGREPAEKTTLGVASTTVTLTDYLTVYDSLSLWYGAEVKPPEPRRNRHFLGSQAGSNGFRGLGSSSSQLDAVQSQWGNRLRTGIRALRRLPWRAGGASREGPTGARFIHRWTHASINRRVQGVEERFFPVAPSRPTPILSNRAFVPVTEVPAFLESRPWYRRPLGQGAVAGLRLRGSEPDAISSS
jgi:hypothetical protein